MHLACQAFDPSVDRRVFADYSQLGYMVSRYQFVNFMHLVRQARPCTLRRTDNSHVDNLDLRYQCVNFRIKPRKHPCAELTVSSHVDSLDSWYKFVNFMHLVYQALGQSVDPRVLARCG